ncbi:unnamed protein product [Camellia sinensis]
MILQMLTLPILLSPELFPNVYQILALKVFKLCRKYSHLSLVNGKRLFVMIRSSQASRREKEYGKKSFMKSLKGNEVLGDQIIEKLKLSYVVKLHTGQSCQLEVCGLENSVSTAIWFLGRVFARLVEPMLISSKEEVDAPDSFCIQPIDLNHIFEEDGKIYGYQGLKLSPSGSTAYLFMHMLRLRFRAHLMEARGITDLKSAPQSIVSKGEILQQNTTNGHNSDSNSYLKTDYSDLEDGSNTIDITDPRWEILLIVQKKIDLQGGNQLRLLGFAAIYRFYHYLENLRLRLS